MDDDIRCEQTVIAEKDEEKINLPFQSDLSHLSLAEIQELRARIGIKEFNKRYCSKVLKSCNKRSNTKSSKNSRPLEMSSKKPSSYNVKQQIKKAPVTRDPRFDDLSGEYNEQLFKNSYRFVERLQNKEYKALQKMVGDSELDDDTRKKAKHLITRLNQKKASKKKNSAKDRVEVALKEERKQALKEGKRPYFVKPALKKKLILAEKYKELKDKGQLESYMKKQRKKNSEKSKSALPGLANP